MVFFTYNFHKNLRGTMHSAQLRCQNCLQKWFTKLARLPIYLSFFYLFLSVYSSLNIYLSNFYLSLYPFIYLIFNKNLKGIYQHYKTCARKLVIISNCRQIFTCELIFFQQLLHRTAIEIGNHEQTSRCTDCNFASPLALKKEPNSCSKVAPSASSRHISLFRSLSVPKVFIYTANDSKKKSS